MATRVLVCCRTSCSGAFPPPSFVLACYWSMVVCYWSISQSQTTTQLAAIWAPLHGDQQHTGTLVVASYLTSPFNIFWVWSVLVPDWGRGGRGQTSSLLRHARQVHDQDEQEPHQDRAGEHPRRHQGGGRGHLRPSAWGSSGWSLPWQTS